MVLSPLEYCCYFCITFHIPWMTRSLTLCLILRITPRQILWTFLEMHYSVVVILSSVLTFNAFTSQRSIRTPIRRSGQFLEVLFQTRVVCVCVPKVIKYCGIPAHPHPLSRICFALLVMRKGGESSWSGPWHLRCRPTLEDFHVHSYQDQFIQPGWAESVFLCI